MTNIYKKMNKMKNFNKNLNQLILMQKPEILHAMQMPIH